MLPFRHHVLGLAEIQEPQTKDNHNLEELNIDWNYLLSKLLSAYI